MDQDIRLIRRMKAGDDGAIEEFVAKYYPRILQYCRLHIHDRGYAEDAAQETFEKFFRSFAQYRHYGKAGNYLYVIAGNLCRDFYRKRTEREREILTEELSTVRVESGEMPEGEIERAQERLAVETAVDRLSPELKEVAILAFFQGRKQTEIARILGIGLPLVKYRIRRARECLAKALGGEESG